MWFYLVVLATGLAADESSGESNIESPRYEALELAYQREEDMSSGCVRLKVTPAMESAEHLRESSPLLFEEAGPEGVFLDYAWSGWDLWRIQVRALDETLVRELRCDGFMIDTGDGLLWDVRFQTDYTVDPREDEFESLMWPHMVAAQCHVFPLTLGRNGDYREYQFAGRDKTKEREIDPGNSRPSQDFLISVLGGVAWTFRYSIDPVHQMPVSISVRGIRSYRPPFLPANNAHTSVYARTMTSYCGETWPWLSYGIPALVDGVGWLPSRCEVAGLSDSEDVLPRYSSLLVTDPPFSASEVNETWFDVSQDNGMNYVPWRPPPPRPKRTSRPPRRTPLVERLAEGYGDWIDTASIGSMIALAAGVLVLGIVAVVCLRRVLRPGSRGTRKGSAE